MNGLSDIIPVCAALLFVAAALIAVIKCKRLEKSLKNCGFLLKTVAHDMRSPLTNIKGYADAMLDGNIPENERENALAIISLESDRLARLSSRLLSGDKDYEPKKTVFDVTEILYRAKLALEYKARRDGVSLLCGEPSMLYVSADCDAVYEALFNLCDNALKYSDGEDRTVSLSAEKTESGKISVSVSNTGAEIPQNEIEKLFDLSFRGKEATEKSVGSGLGLYIASNLIKAHGSTISVTSENGVNTFRFELDAAE